MTHEPSPPHRVRSCRQALGWTQAQLAERAAVGRTSITEIEAGHLSPSVDAALAIARALGVSVEELFGLGHSAGSQTTAWAWQPTASPCRFWEAEVAGRVLHYPIDSTALSCWPHDGVFRKGAPQTVDLARARQTLVVACCDPSASLIAGQYAQSIGFRMAAFFRSSQQALDLLEQGLVHLAGVHLAAAEDDQGHARLIRERLGGGYTLFHAAKWQEGVVLPTDSGIRTLRGLSTARLDWVGREAGSGAQRCLDELLPRRRMPRIARSHAGVIEAVRGGWADAGISMRFVAEEAGLRFLPVREERYDLCLRTRESNDPRLQGLFRLLRAPDSRRMLGELPGYDTRDSGECEAIE